MNKENNELALRIFITNLGAYNRGDLAGEWVEMPISPESLEMVFERIGVGQLNEYNEIDEEYFITDYDGRMPSDLCRSLSEYESIETLQVLGAIFEKINELGDNAIETFEALLEQFNYLDAAENVLNNRAIILNGVEDNYDLGLYIVNEYYDGAENYPKDKVEMYFNYEEFGRRMKDEYDVYNEDTIEDALGLDDNASFEEIGLAYESMIGGFNEISNPEEYIDFERIGRDADLGGSYIFADGFAIDYCECEELGDDLYEEIKNDLIDNGILPEPYENSRDDDFDR